MRRSVGRLPMLGITVAGTLSTLLLATACEAPLAPESKQAAAARHPHGIGQAEPGAERHTEPFRDPSSEAPGPTQPVDHRAEAAEAARPGTRPGRRRQLAAVPRRAWASRRRFASSSSRRSGRPSTRTTSTQATTASTGPPPGRAISRKSRPSTTRRRSTTTSARWCPACPPVQLLPQPGRGQGAVIRGHQLRRHRDAARPKRHGRSRRPRALRLSGRSAHTISRGSRAATASWPWMAIRASTSTGSAATSAPR